MTTAVPVEPNEGVVACAHAGDGVEILFVWQSPWVELGRMPFTEASRCLAPILEEFGNGDFVAFHGGTYGTQVAGLSCGSKGTAAGHECDMGWCPHAVCA